MDNNNKQQPNGREQFAAQFQRTLAALAASAQQQSGPGTFPQFPNQQQMGGGGVQPSGPMNVSSGLAPVLAGIAPPALFDGISGPRPAVAARPALPPRPNSANGFIPQPPGMGSAFRPQMPYFGGGPPSHQQHQHQHVNPIPESPDEDLKRRLPSMLTAAVKLQQQWPGMMPDEFKRQMERLIGPLPTNAKLPTTIPPDVYPIVQHHPNAQAAYAMLHRTLSSSAGGVGAGGGGGGGGPSGGQVGYNNNNNNTYSRQQEQTTHSKNVPESVKVMCNGMQGVFYTKEQVIACDCRNCKLAAVNAGLEQLAMSPGEFERHCGLVGSRKWKLTIRVVGKKNPVIGKWLEEHGIKPKAHKPIGLVRALVPDKEGRQVLIETKKPRAPKPDDSATVATTNNNTAAQQQQQQQGNNTSMGDGGTTDDFVDDSEEEEDDDEDTGTITPPSHNHNNTTTGGNRPASAAGMPPLAGGGSSRRKPFTTSTINKTATTGNGGGERPGLRSPTGKRWMTSPTKGGYDNDTDVRMGSNYQAEVATTAQPRPTTTTDDDDDKNKTQTMQPSEERLLGTAAPDTQTALASATGAEFQNAQSLPRDALKDVWLGGAGEHLAKRHRSMGVLPAGDSRGGNETSGDLDNMDNIANRRNARNRKPPQWMQNQVDPTEALAARSMVPDIAWNPGQAKRSKTEAFGDATGGGGGYGQDGGKRYRPDVTTRLSLAVQAGHLPEIANWKITDHGELQLVVKIGNNTFKGLLPPPEAPSLPKPPPKQQQQQMQQQVDLPVADMLLTAAGYVNAINNNAGGGFNNNKQQQQQHPQLTSAFQQQAAGSTGQPLQQPPLPSRGEGSRGGLPRSKKNEKTEERRRAAEAEFERLSIEGPPPGTKCALCHGGVTDEVPEDGMGPGGRSPVGLGHFQLVKVSVMTHAWVHDQCARWSPEVFDPTGEDDLEGVPECVRRGRLIRCRVCGDKGATLGCLKVTCKHSYHLPCARRYGCLMQMDPYIVACPEHVDKLPPELMRARRAIKKKPKRMVEALAAEYNNNDHSVQADYSQRLIYEQQQRAGSGGGQQQQQQQQRYVPPVNTNPMYGGMNTIINNNNNNNPAIGRQGSGVVGGGGSIISGGVGSGFGGSVMNHMPVIGQQRVPLPGGSSVQLPPSQLPPASAALARGNSGGAAAAVDGGGNAGGGGGGNLVDIGGGDYVVYASGDDSQ